MAAKLYKNEDLNPDGTPKEGAVGIDVTDTKAIQRLLLENIDKLIPEDFARKEKPKADLGSEPNVQKMSIEVDDVVEFISEVVKEAEKAAIDVAEAIKTAKAKLKELGVPDDLTNEAFEKYQQGTKKPRIALPKGHPDFKKKMEEYNKNQVEQMLKEKREAQPIEKFKNVYKGVEKLHILLEQAKVWKAEQEAKKQHNQPIAKMENKKLTLTLKHKKIIAREFLLFIIAIVTPFLVYFALHGANAYQKYKIDGYYKDASIANDTAKPLIVNYNKKKDKQAWYFDKYGSWGFSQTSPDIDTPDELWANSCDYFYDVDSIASFYNAKSMTSFFNYIGIKSPYELKYFIKENTLTNEDISNKKEGDRVLNMVSEINIKRIDAQNSIIDKEEIYRLSVNSFWVLVIILFGFRFLYYAIIWSIKTLKTN